MDKRRSVVVGLVMAMAVALTGCAAAGRSSSPQSPAPAPAPAHSEQTAESGQALLTEALRVLDELENKAAPFWEKRIQNLRHLYESGRASEEDVLRAELDALEWRRRLLFDRLQLRLPIDRKRAEAAQQGAAADDRPQAGDRG